MNIFQRIAEKARSLDKDDVIKWGCVIGAGVIGLIGNIYDKKKKDREYNRAVNEAINARVAKLTIPVTSEQEE